MDPSARGTNALGGQKGDVAAASSVSAPDASSSRYSDICSMPRLSGCR